MTLQDANVFNVMSNVARQARANHGVFIMAWKTPKIVEIPVGLEINSYACAVRE
jgi:coenzyme PQQ precursor peptide PqqA